MPMKGRCDLSINCMEKLILHTFMFSGLCPRMVNKVPNKKRIKIRFAERRQMYATCAITLLEALPESDI